MNDCQCDIQEGGFCQRHQVQKAKHWVKLCRTNERYWKAWEEGRGPGQVIPEELREKQNPRGVGTILRKLLGCGCNVNYKQFNEWGPDKCEQNLDLLVEAVCASHRKKGQCVSEDSARRLAIMAIERARKNMESSDANHNQT